MSKYQGGSDPLPELRLRRMARAFNCPQIASDPLGPVVTGFLNSWRAGTDSQTNLDRLVALQGRMVEQEQTCFFGVAPFDERA
jgi:hypothetical protein